MARVVCFGELLLRLTAPGNELLFQSGRLDANVGGAEANVAVALARLGHEAFMISCIPDNALGEAAVGHLRRYGVDTTGVVTGNGRMGLYFVSSGAGARPSSITYDREGSSFCEAQPDAFDWRLMDGAALVHLSGINPALCERAGAATLDAIEAARAAGAMVSFDGNYRSQLWDKRRSDPRPVLSALVDKSDIFFGNHRDIALLLGAQPSGDGVDRRRDAALAAFAAFPRLKAIASTSRHIDDKGWHRIAARVDTPETFVQTTEVLISSIVDRIGAGDAFAAGVLHGMLTGKDHETSAHYGLALAALKHGLPGDCSLFRQNDIDAFIAGERDVRR